MHRVRLRWRLPFCSCPASARRGPGGALAGGPRRRSWRKLQLDLRGCQQGRPHGEAIDCPCIPFARHAPRPRRRSASSRHVDSTGRTGREGSWNGNREDPTDDRHRSLVPHSLRGRKARRQRPKRLSTVVAPYHRMELPGRFEYRAYRFATGVHRQHHRLKAGHRSREPSHQWLHNNSREPCDDPQFGDKLPWHNWNRLDAGPKGTAG
jgi:hypothetical protein